MHSLHPVGVSSLLLQMLLKVKARATSNTPARSTRCSVRASRARRSRTSIRKGPASSSRLVRLKNVMRGSPSTSRNGGIVARFHERLVEQDALVVAHELSAIPCISRNGGAPLRDVCNRPAALHLVGDGLNGRAHHARLCRSGDIMDHPRQRPAIVLRPSGVRRDNTAHHRRRVLQLRRYGLERGSSNSASASDSIVNSDGLYASSTHRTPLD